MIREILVPDRPGNVSDCDAASVLISVQQRLLKTRMYLLYLRTKGNCRPFSVHFVTGLCFFHMGSPPPIERATHIVKPSTCSQVPFVLCTQKMQ